jgi:nucleoside-diphosphate-sugar epimerase
MDYVILVTGANGFIGRHCVDALASQNDTTVVATDMTPPSSTPPPRKTLSAPYEQGDLTDEAFVAHLQHTYSFTHIVHCAAILGSSDDAQARRTQFSVNTLPTLSLCECARQHAAHLIFPSTGLVYDPGANAPFSEEDTPCAPASFYAVTKQVSEEIILLYARTYDIRYTIFRPSVVYGPGQHGAMFLPSLIDALAHGGSFDMTPGEQKRDFIYIGDVVNAVAKAVRTPIQARGTFNLSTAKAVTMKEVAAIVEEMADMKGAVHVGALPYRDNETWQYCLDNTRLRSRLQWQPWTSLHNGIRAMWRAALERGDA